MKCRHCESTLTLSMVDLGTSPPSNSYLKASQLNSPEAWFPLRVLVCEKCWLVQTQDFNQASDLFTEDYAYFSSYSSSWLEHARLYVEKMVQKFHLDKTSRVIEVASNDGYLLQYFKKLEIECLGIEPTKSTARAAEAKGIKIVQEFFGTQLAQKLLSEAWGADLMAANNVLAHVPDINDFTQGFSRLLKNDGVATFEFPHLLHLVKNHLFDTIYHEHYSYLSLFTVREIFDQNNLQVFDVEELSTHGGSLRVYAQRKDTGQRSISKSVEHIIKNEKLAGLFDAQTYRDFQRVVEQRKHDFIDFLIRAKREGKSVAAYGAAAKGNTFINYAGIRSDLLSWIVDRNPDKQDKYMPGSRIPIVAEAHLKLQKPDYLVLLPWNLKSELTSQLSYIKDWKGRFVIAQPNLEIL